MDGWKKVAAILGVSTAAVLTTSLKQHEGVRLASYKDPVGIITACIGHTGPELKLGQRFNATQCDEMLYQDILEANQVVESCVRVPLTSNQRAALISFAFNVGHGQRGVKDGLCELKSGQPSSIVRYFNQGKPKAACEALLGWVYAGGRVLPGLVTRRKHESELCLAN